MKKFLTTLLAAFICTLTINASTAEAIPAVEPTHIIKVLNKLEKSLKASSSTNKASFNPDTKEIHYNISVMDFDHKADASSMKKALNQAYTTDSHCGIQMIHMEKGEGSPVLIGLIDGVEVKARESADEEMYILIAKNPENPNLRDFYSIAWEEKGNKVEGRIFRGSILPPANQPADTIPEIKPGKFIIEGKVDNEILDSCYNIYIGDYHSQITDENLVACIPVRDKRFHYEVDLDKAKAGRLRCIFPGNELCSAWIDIHFIPGLTVYMTVHNGYYDIANQTEYNRRVSESVYASAPEQANEADDDGIITAAEVMAASQEDAQLEKQTKEIAQKRAVLQAKGEALEEALEFVKGKITDLTYNINLKVPGWEEDQKALIKYKKKAEELSDKMLKLLEQYADDIK